jgi:hypothetical protein
MGWRGALRSFAAAARAAEREAQRQHKAAVQQQTVNDAAAAVDDWENYIENLVRIHARLGDAIDWRAMAAKPQPQAPSQSAAEQQAAEAALASFRPGMFDVFAGGTAKRRGKLEQALADAPARDAQIHTAALEQYRIALADWETDTALARRVVAGEAKALSEVIGEMSKAIEGQSLIGSEIAFSIDDNFVHAQPKVHDTDIIPAVRRKQLASGRLSESKMPAGQFNELYQDYVASVALKVGGELFHVLPLSEVYVTCLATMLNPQTGHKQQTPILSVQFVRDTFFKLNLNQLDPSDAMRNFHHAMSFKKAQGFAAIEPLKPLSQIAS